MKTLQHPDFQPLNWSQKMARRSFSTRCSGFGTWQQVLAKRECRLKLVAEKNNLLGNLESVVRKQQGS
jgi:hypothetical protein